MTTPQLSGANFWKANLTGTDLSHAFLKGADFNDTNLDGAYFDESYMGWTTFANVDLSVVEGLQTVNHGGPSTVGIDTLERSKGKIPLIFLRGVGVSKRFIEQLPALTTQSQQYYSCFISYSSIDQRCAERLHADLQAAGVRCWFAPHNMEIGIPIMRGIDEAIRSYDKLLLILSEASVNSPWVEFEVNQALHRETEQERTMLFPIRLDNTVLSTPNGWAAQLRSRHIGDFRNWKQYDSYQKAFQRLLRDLTRTN